MPHRTPTASPEIDHLIGPTSTRVVDTRAYLAPKAVAPRPQNRSEYRLNIGSFTKELDAELALKSTEERNSCGRVGQVGIP